MRNENLRDKLGRFASLIGPQEKPAHTPGPPGHYSELADELGGVLCSNHCGSYCLIHDFCDTEEAYRRSSQSHSRLSDELPVSAFRALDEPGLVALDSLLFLDIETTGLGGAGSVAFLIGCGSVVDKRFEVRQYLIPDYSDEAAMLEALMTEFSDCKSIVTYNGASFDLPLVLDRLIVNRVARQIPRRDHFDLLHAARRLFKRRLDDCTLLNIERELLGLDRCDDLPGYLVPSAYFEWLSTRRTDLIKAVLKHNKQDIVSLFHLAIEIATAFRSRGESLENTDDLCSLARIYYRRRQYQRVADLCFQMQMDGDGTLAPDITLLCAGALKSMADHRQAESLWLKLAALTSKEAYWANLELAKYYEHKLKDLKKALHHARMAQSIAPRRKSYTEGLARRLKRLMAKSEAV